jgi:anthranilate phosphoribosyltransferase
MMIRESIEKLIRQENLDSEICQEIMERFINQPFSLVHASAFLVLLRAKKETAEELAGFLRALKQKTIPLHFPFKVLDMVGTGGDRAHTVNISTGSAILAASNGVKIVKHGNRAVSSLAGSADVLEALGVNIYLAREKMSACVDLLGIGFCFSPNFNPIMRLFAPLRQSLSVATCFNLLGPLLNPASPEHILLGVFEKDLLSLMAETLQKMGTARSMVVHGCTLDEISCVGKTLMLEVSSENIQEMILDPEVLGFSLCTLDDLRGGDAWLNAARLQEVFEKGAKTKHKGLSDTLILNAAVASVLYGKHGSIEEAVLASRENMYDGSAYRLLKKWVEYTNDEST